MVTLRRRLVTSSNRLASLSPPLADMYIHPSARSLRTRQDLQMAERSPAEAQPREDRMEDGLPERYKPPTPTHTYEPARILPPPLHVFLSCELLFDFAER